MCEPSWENILYLFIYLFIYLLLFRATPVAYRSSQARGQIGAAAVNLYHSSPQCWILNLLSETRDQTMSSWILVRYC